MNVFSLSIYDKFDCIGAQCPWTCCQGWKIQLDNESLERYHSVPGKIGDEMRESILCDANGNAYIKLNKDRFCPLLNEQKLCRIYIEAGEDKMCSTCQQYPRGVNIYGDLYMKYICISCPEVARLLFSQKEPLNFHITEDDAILSPKTFDFDWNYFNALKDGMFTTIQILQNRIFPMSARMQMALFFNDLFRDCLLKNGNKDDIIAMFTRQETLSETYNNLQKFPKRTDYLNRMFLEFNHQIVASPDNLWDIIRYIEIAIYEFQSSKLEDIVSLAEFINSNTFCTIYENYCVYYIVQHYLTGYDKKNPQDCIIKMIQFCIIFAWLFGLYNPQKEQTLTDYAVITAIFSRRTEHNPNSVFNVICDKLIQQGMGTTEYLLSILT